MNTETLQSRLDMNPEEQMLVRAITERGIKMANAFGRFPDVLQTMMDIAFCHKLHCPLRLREWLNADDIAFAVDFTALLRHFDRQRFVLPDHVKLHFAVSNEASRIIVPENISLKRH